MLIPRRPRTFAAACAAAALTCGCGTGAVRIAVPSPGPATARLCADLRLPGTVRGETAREVSPASSLTAAWGRPAIALRCGVPRPAALLPTSQLITVNGVPWFPYPADRPVTYTAVGREAYMEVTVPAKYHPAGDVLIELGDVVTTLPAKPDGEL